MYEVIVTEDFIRVVQDIPLCYLGILLQSFVSVKRLESEDVECNLDSTFVDDLLKCVGK